MQLCKRSFHTNLFSMKGFSGVITGKRYPVKTQVMYTSSLLWASQTVFSALNFYWISIYVQNWRI